MQYRQLDVLGAKIVPPLRNAVRFVDGEQRDLRAFKQGKEARCHQTFRSHIKQSQ